MKFGQDDRRIPLLGLRAAALGRTTGAPAFPLSLLGPPKIVK